MKLSHLSLAIFAAISLAACGGSGDNNQVNPEPQPQPQPQPQPEPTNPDGDDQEIVDPTGDEVVTYFRLKEKSSQGTTQYLRNGKSNFDRKNNPEEPASATSILGVDLNKQNPWFTNFVAARTKFTKDGKSVTVAQFLGTDKTGQAGLTDAESLQTENFKNIKRVENISAGRLAGISKKDYEDAKEAAEKVYEDYIEELNTLKEAAGTTDEQKAEIDQAIAAATAQYKTLLAAVDAEYKTAPYITLTQDNQAGDAGTSVDTTGRKATHIIWGDGVEADAANSSKAAIGLVGMNFIKQDDQGANVNPAETKKIQGTDDKAVTSSRIFGRYFLADDQPGNIKAKIVDGNYNSYRKATTFVNNADLDVPAVKVDNLKTEWGATTYGIAVEPMELVNVQYGRVTGQLDPASEPKDAAFDEGGVIEQREKFLGRNADEAVNYYFYRGTNAATIEQMAALPSDAIIQYQGHALMYGIDNSYHGNGLNLPNSFGDTGSLGLGNFVVAKYDVGQARVGGIVYNAWQFDNKKADLEIDKLVEFGGKVTGNSVVGTANLAYKQAPTADFRASFFGDQAQELGGSFNSTTWGEKYGPAEGAEVWGGVFGAQRVDEPKVKEEATIDNSWLGDIGADVRK